MRPSTLLTPVIALATATTALDFNSYTSDLAQLTASAAALASSFENANPTSVVNSALALASQELQSLSNYAATATGSLGSALRAEQTSLAAYISEARASATAALGMTATGPGAYGTATQNVSPAASGSASGVPSQGRAAATGMPVAAGVLGLGMAALAVL